MKVMRLVSLAVGLAYLVWRAAFTWEGANLALFVLLLVAEAYGIVRTALELSLARNRVRPDPPRVVHEPPEADVMILALDEPTSEIRAAVLSARAIRGRGRVTLVDRDGRPELDELAQRLEVAHVTGSAKADVGALLTKAAWSGSAERIVILPGDVVVMPDITSVTEACFDDAQVAVVAGQIEDTNASHEVDYDGYGQNRVRDAVVAPSLDADHALPWWAGVSVIRREALEEIGGFAPDRRSAMMATGVRMQVGGWRIADNRVVVGRRLVDWSEARHLHRWSRDLYERLNLLRREDVSWNSPRITPRMRLAYYSALIDGTRPLQRLVLIGVLFATLAGVGLPVGGQAPLVAVAWAGQMGLRLLARHLATRPAAFRPWILADLRLLTTELLVAWRVARHRRVDEEFHDPAPGLRSRGVLLWMLHVGLPVAAAVNVLGLRRAPYDDPAMVAMIAAACWLWIVAFQARAALKLRQVRRTFRATEDLDVLNSRAGLAVVGVSPFGIDVVSKEVLRVGDRLRLAFALPAADGSSNRMEVTTVVRRCSRDGKRYVGYLRFSLINDEEMDRVIEYCAVVAGHREMREGQLGLSAELIVPGSHPAAASPADEAVPDEAVADEAVPDEAVADEAAPDEAAPDETVADEAAPVEEPSGIGAEADSDRADSDAPDEDQVDHWLAGIGRLITED